MKYFLALLLRSADELASAAVWRLVAELVELVAAWNGNVGLAA